MQVRRPTVHASTCLHTRLHRFIYTHMINNPLIISPRFLALNNAQKIGTHPTPLSSHLPQILRIRIFSLPFQLSLVWRQVLVLSSSAPLPPLAFVVSCVLVAIFYLLASSTGKKQILISEKLSSFCIQIRFLCRHSNPARIMVAIFMSFSYI